MTSEEGRFAGGFGILMHRGNLRHTTPILGLLGVVAEDHDAPGKPFDDRLCHEPLLPVAEEPLRGPCAGMKEVQQRRIVHRG